MELICPQVDERHWSRKGRGLAERTPRTEERTQNNQAGISLAASSQPEAITKGREPTGGEKQPNAGAVLTAAIFFIEKKMQKMNKCQWNLFLRKLSDLLLYTNTRRIIIFYIVV